MITNQKTCFKCLKAKPVDEFYKHRRMADGRLGKCKDCAKADATEHRNRNIDRIRAYDMERAKSPKRAAATVKTSKAWRQKDPRFTAAHNAVARAIRRGDLVRSPCEKCGREKAFAHHESYDKKLDVVWLCQPCHKNRHKEMALLGINP